MLAGHGKRVSSARVLCQFDWARQLDQLGSTHRARRARTLAPLRVNAVSPGVIDTQWWHGLPEEQRAGFFQAVAAASPVRRVGTPADVAAAIVYLAGAGFVTGTVLECAGGANLTVGAVAG